jgi:hypothetical protein
MRSPQSLFLDWSVLVPVTSSAGYLLLKEHGVTGQRDWRYAIPTGRAPGLIRYAMTAGAKSGKVGENTPNCLARQIAGTIKDLVVSPAGFEPATY